MESVAEVYKGPSITRFVNHGGPSVLTVYDAAGQAQSTEFAIAENPPNVVADAGGPYLLPESSATDSGLPLVLDGS